MVAIAELRMIYNKIRKILKRKYLHHCLIDIVMDKTIASADGIETSCGKSTLIP